jgi:bleomycin hydrolase
MKKGFKNLLLILFIILFASNFIISKELGISKKLLKELKKSINPNNPIFKMRLNAISNNNPSELVVNTEVLKKFHDYNFSNKIDIKGITNQKRTGRCWLFAGYNVLRFAVIKKLKLKNFELSQNYGMFYDKLEKANLFMEGIIATAKKPLLNREVDYWLKNPIPDGGQWNMVVNLVEKYGVVPKDIMPETYNSSNSGMMNRILSKLLRKDAVLLRKMVNNKISPDKIHNQKVKMLKDVYKLLVYFLGIPPEEFNYRYKTGKGKLSPVKTYTPQSFYKEFININLKDFVMIYNAPHKQFYKHYTIKYDKDMADKKDMEFINLPVNYLKDIAKKSIIAGEPVWFGCDVGKEFDGKKGLLLPGIHDYKSLFGIDFSMNKRERILYRQSIPTHAMVLTAVDIQNGKSVKWKIENSWGMKSGKNGFLIMEDNWFDYFVFAIVVNKQYVPQKFLNILKQKPEVLPPWDPMFK